MVLASRDGAENATFGTLQGVCAATLAIITHFLTECPDTVTCSAVLAACNNLPISPTVDTVL